jgi:hypothetical protein
MPKRCAGKRTLVSGNDQRYTGVGCIFECLRHGMDAFLDRVISVVFKKFDLR